MNKVILLGNVGRDPEVRTSNQGKKYAKVTLATTERGFTMANGTKVEEVTTWHNLILWNNNNGNGLASTVEKFIRKGSKISVVGKIRNNVFEDEEGKKRYSCDIVVEDMEILTWIENITDLGTPTTQSSEPQQPSVSKQTAPPVQKSEPVYTNVDDDDLPF
ncbi:MAG: single-stranded DNA-binding protein [Novosphingobium sp.]|nr:single-stranded DNA-binding protein [Novosphingobium sp.]